MFKRLLMIEFNNSDLQLLQQKKTKKEKNRKRFRSDVGY